MDADSMLGKLANKLFGAGTADGEFDTIPGMINNIFNLDQKHGASLTSVVKRTLIGSNVYIESTLAKEDEIMVPLMGVLSQLYTGYVLTALNIYESIERYRPIALTMGRIATESLALDALDPILDIKDMFAGTEATRDQRLTRIDIEESVKHLAAGRFIEFDFRTGDGGTNKAGVQTGRPIEGQNGNTVPGIVTVPMYIQLYPVTMPQDVAVALVQFNYPERFWRRLTKMLTHEIRFMRDFILGFDMVKKHRKVLKKDSNNVLSDFYHDKFAKQSRRIMDILLGRNRNNIANSMLVITADTFKQINDEASIDLSNFVDRQRFFNEAYAMVLAVVDTTYNVVDFYYSGIAHHSELPFRAIKQAGSSKSGVDLEELMRTIARGAAPKF
jgi:hypothetical protein